MDVLKAKTKQTKKKPATFILYQLIVFYKQKNT